MKIDHFTISVVGRSYDATIAGTANVANPGSDVILADAGGGTVTDAEWLIPNVMFLPNCFLKLQVDTAAAQTWSGLATPADRCLVTTQKDTTQAIAANFPGGLQNV